jgi:hypothetical protein
MTSPTAVIALSLSLGCYILYTCSRSYRRIGMRSWLRFKARRREKLNHAFYNAFADQYQSASVPAYVRPKCRCLNG